jgi:hypothetical protein
MLCGQGVNWEPRKSGFKTNLGMENNRVDSALETGGGYYIGGPLTTLALRVVIDWDAKIQELANTSSTGTSRSNTVPLSHFIVFCAGYFFPLPFLAFVDGVQGGITRSILYVEF